MSAVERATSIPQPLAHFIAGELARAIELGHYKPGERLVETEIAARYGVSRAPVREALRMLTKDELVVQRPRRGTVVMDLSPAEISEMFELRSGLYAAAVRLFTRRATAQAIDGLAALFRRISDLANDPAVTPVAFVEATQAASVFVLSHCGNRRLEDSVRTLTSQSYRHYAHMAHSTAEQRQRLADFTEQMMQAMRARDVEAATTIAWRLHESNHAAALAAIAADEASA